MKRKYPTSAQIDTAIDEHNEVENLAAELNINVVWLPNYKVALTDYREMPMATAVNLLQELKEQRAGVLLDSLIEILEAR